MPWMPAFNDAPTRIDPWRAITPAWIDRPARTHRRPDFRRQYNWRRDYSTAWRQTLIRMSRRSWQTLIRMSRGRWQTLIRMATARSDRMSWMTGSRCSRSIRYNTRVLHVLMPFCFLVYFSGLLKTGFSTLRNISTVLKPANEMIIAAVVLRYSPM